MKRAVKEQYPTDTVDLVAQGSVERILQPNQIRKTLDVRVDHHDGSLDDRPDFGEASV